MGNRGTARRRGILLGGAALSLAAALLHALALSEHLREWWGYGMFFLIAALAQALYGAALLRRPGQVCYLLGIGGHLAIVALYLVTRTVGIPLVGPHAGVVHEAGALDLATTLIELALVGALVALTRWPAQLKAGVLLGAAQASFAGFVLQRPGALADHAMNPVLHWLVGATLAVPFAILGALAGAALARRAISRRRQRVGAADTVAERLIWALITAALSAPAGALANQAHLRIVATPRMDTHGAGGIHVRRVVDTPPVDPPLAWDIVPDIAAALGAALVLLLVFAAVRGLPWEPAPRRRWRPRVVAFSQASTRIALAASVAASLIPAQLLASLTPLGRSFALDTAAAAITCGVTRSYSVAAINVTIPYNRWGDTDPNGMIYVLQADKDAVKNWDVPLNHVRIDQGAYAPGVDPAGGRRLRPRPLVLRANAGDCVSVTFTNELQQRQWGGELMNPRASIHVHGPSYDVQTADGGAIGFNDDTTIAIGESITYLWQAPPREGLYFFHDHASPAGSEADGGSNVHGLFGALAVEPAGSSWFDPISGGRLDGASPYLDPVIRGQSGELYLDAEIRSPAGTFRESVQLAQDEIPGIGFGFNYGAEPQNNRDANRCPDCIGEETSLSSWVYGDPALVKLASGLGPWLPKKPDSTPASYSWTVDTAAPGAPAVGLAAASDSGASSADGITNDSTPTLTGTAEAGSTVTISAAPAGGAAAPLGSATAGAAGAWSFTPAAALADGPYAIVATATDAAGNTSGQSATLSVTIDTVAPETTILSGPEGLTSSRSATVTYGASEAAVFGCKFDAALDFTACPATGWSNTALADGAHTLEVRATDAAGNTDPTPASRSWTVDATAPGAPAVGLAAASDSGASSADGITNDSTPTLTGTAEAGSTVTISAAPAGGAAAPLGSATAGAAGAWSFTPAAALADGPYAIVATATDAAGNTSGQSATLSVTIDTVAPTATVASGPTGAVNSRDATFTYTASETAAFECRLDAAAFASCDALGQSYTALADGAHTFEARATDAAGNSGAAAARAWSIDATAPNAPAIVSPVDGGTQSTSAFTVDGTAEAASTVELFEAVTTNGVTSLVSLGTAPADGAGNWSVALSGVADGTHTYRARATDAVQNSSALSAPSTVTVSAGVAPAPAGTGPAAEGTDAPASTTGADAPAASGAETVCATDAPPPTTGIDTAIVCAPKSQANSSSASFTYAATVANAIFECKIDGKPWQECAADGITYPGMSDGEHTFQVRATAPSEDCGLIGAVAGVVSCFTSNVFHAYPKDPTKVRYGMSGVKETHVFHLHAHQWQSEPADAKSPIIDSQTFGPGEMFTADIISGAGSAPGAFGDSIFHCHLYPHFAEGMWSLMRVHDVLENGRGKTPDQINVRTLRPLAANAPPAPTADNPGFPRFIPGQFGWRAPQPPNGVTVGGPTAARAPRIVAGSKVATNEFGYTPLEEQVRLKNYAAGAAPKAGAPFRDPCPATARQVTYNVSVIQRDIVYNEAGWHDTQGRLLVLDKDVGAVLAGKKEPEPLFIRVNAGDCINFNLTNRVPNWFGGDAFVQLQQTNMMGGHIHLVKFDVLGSDGSSNGWNYQEAAFSKQQADFNDGVLAGAQSCTEAGCRIPDSAGAAYTPAGSQDFPGQTIHERWYADTELKTVFTHDHHFPAVDQNRGQFGALIVEPAGVDYRDPRSGAFFLPGTRCGASCEGDAAGWMMDIIGPGPNDDFREFGLAFQDFVSLTRAGGDPRNPADTFNPPAAPERFPDEDPGVMGINYRNAPFLLRDTKNGAPVDPAYRFSSTVFGDPKTPLLQAYAGDSVRIRLIQGSQEEQHAFTLHGMRWRDDPDDPNSPLVNTKAIGISEAFSMQIPRMECGVDEDCRGDYLYSGAATDDLYLGMWGIFRVYGKGVNGLLPLPDNVPQAVNGNTNFGVTGSPPPKANKPGTPCPANAAVRKYNVVALQAKLTYNEKGDNDPYGLLYTLAREGETPDQTVERVQTAARHEPLTLRANEGDCVEVTLTNKLTDAFLAHAGVADGDAPLPLEPPVGTRAGLRVSLHPQLVLYDVRYSDGATVGFNRDQTVGPGETITYRWYADDVSPGELGATNLTDYGDVRGHRHHGLFAGLNIEPKNATYHDPYTGAQIESGAAADIRVPGMKDFREFTLYFQDGLNLRDSSGAIIADPSAHPGVDEALDAEDGGEKGFNYTNAPFLHRLGREPVQASVTSPLDGQALARVFSSKVHGDPKTPIFRAYTGDPVRMRVLQGADKPRQHAFQQNGHAWKPQPDDPNSVPIGTQGGFTVARALNVELPAAGAGGAAAGDYRYACGVYFHHQSGGLWGLLRVYAPPAAKPVFKPTPLKATDNPRDAGYFPLMPLEQAQVTARVFDDGNMDGARGNSEVAAPKVKFNLRDTAGVVLDTRETTAETQAIATTGTGGTFTLGYGASTTAPLAYNATAAQVEQALNALTAAKIKVSVSGAGTAADPWVARFHQPAADQVALLTADDANLTGGTTRVVTRTGQVTFQVARGAYDVEVVLPPDASKPGGSDWALTSPATFRADATAENARADGGDFGMVQLADATIRVFDDRDGSQFLESGEANLAGWTVTLTGGGQTRTATTDANGLAAFDGLKPGSYTADAAAQAGWLATRKVPVTVSLAENESLRPHATDLTLGRDVRLGYALKAGLSVKFFNDSNKNGVQDPGESNLAAWKATASGGPPELPVTVSVETNVDGIATFDDPDPLVEGLRPGAYTLSAQLKPDWSYNSAKATTTLKDGAKEGPVNLSMGSGGYTTTLYKETTQVVAVGLHNPNAWITVAPFNDVNNDGVRQDKESKLTGGQWIATLHQTADGPAIATSPAGNGGLATFYPVPPGTYVVKMAPPPPSADPTVPDWTATTKTQVTVTVIAGETGATRFGFVQLGTLQALVVFDFNQDGVWDGNEQPLANRNVRLYDKVGKTVVAYGATDAEGRIAFKASPGVGYQLEALLPDGWTATAPLGPSGAPVTTVKLTGPSSTTSVETLFGQYSATAEAPALDTTPPTVADMAPGNGETNVPVTSSIVATFSESMDPTTVNGTTFKLLPLGSSTAAPATVVYDGTARKATLKPSASLATNASYTVVVDGATDTAGNPVVKPAWSFQTAPPDTTAPTVTAVAPSDGASQVLVTTHLTVTFSEPLDPTSVTDLTFTLEQVAADKSVTAAPALVSYDGPTMQATLKPKSGLQLSATYRATVKGGAAGVKDAAGNPLAADYRWSFSTVADTTPPPAPTATPAGGAYASALSVTLASEAGATFRYTLDGTTPSATAGTTYSGPILIAQTATLKAVAIDAAGNTSPVTTESYTISAAVTTETVTVAATTWTTTAGTKVSGGVADLATDEGVYLAINAAKVGKKYRVDGYGSYSVPAAQRNLVGLKVDYDGRASVAGVSRTLYLYNFATGAWEALQTETQTGTADLRTTITVTGDPLRFLSATGEIRLRVANSYDTTYRQDADLMTVTLTYKP